MGDTRVPDNAGVHELFVRQCLRPLGSAVSWILVLLSAPALGSGQELGPYVGGALAISPFGVESVSAGSPSTSYGNFGSDATSATAVAEAGWSFHKSAAVGAEVVLQLRRTAIAQSFGYFSPYRRQSFYREQRIMAVLRGQVHSSSRADVDLVGGGGIVRGSSLDRYSHGTFGSSEFGPFGAQSETTHLSVGLTAGVDLVLHLTPAISLVSHFRSLIVPRGDIRDPASSLVSLGLPSLSHRGGIGVRATF